MIIQFIALFFATYLALRETKSTSNIAHVLSRVSNLIDHNKKRKRNKEYDQTKYVFYTRCNS